MEADETTNAPKHAFTKMNNAAITAKSESVHHVYRRADPAVGWLASYRGSNKRLCPSWVRVGLGILFAARLERPQERKLRRGVPECCSGACSLDAREDEGLNDAQSLVSFEPCRPTILWARAANAEKRLHSLSGASKLSLTPA